MFSLNQVLIFGSLVVFSMVFDLVTAERRYCGLSLSKKLVSVCEKTDCSLVSKPEENGLDSHTDGKYFLWISRFKNYYLFLN